MKFYVDSIKRNFNAVQGCLPATYFLARLESVFDSAIANDIYFLFKNIGLTPPEERGEFLKSLEGALIFLNDCNLVLRIEWTEASGQLRFNAKRMDENPYVLQPIASIIAGKVVLEICPGVHQAQSLKEEKALVQALKEEGVEFWDAKLSNMGRLPFKAPRFPKGIPVVIDRLAVCRLTDSAFGIKKVLYKLRGLFVQKSAFDKMKAIAQQAQEELYAPLREAFRAAWPEFSGSADLEKMKAFWDLCRTHAKAGKLIAGWEEEQGPEACKEFTMHGDNDKTLYAKEIAAQYKKKRMAQRA